MGRNGAGRPTGRLELTPLHVRQSGGGASTVVLLHGFGDNGGTWARVTPELNRHFRVLAMDLPGFGNSASRGVEDVFTGYVDAVIETLDDLGVHEPVSIMGNSLGSLTALLVATKHPERVSNVVLTALPGVTGVPRAWSRITSRRAARVSTVLVRGLPQPVLQRLFLATFIRGACAGGAQRNKRAGLHLADDYASRDRLLSYLPLAPTVLRELADLSVVQLVRDVPVPALLVWGDHDRVTPARHRGTFAGSRPPVQIAMVRGAGHCPQLDRPRRLLDVVRPFLLGDPEAQTA